MAAINLSNRRGQDLMKRRRPVPRGRGDGVRRFIMRRLPLCLRRPSWNGGDWELQLPLITVKAASSISLTYS